MNFFHLIENILKYTVLKAIYLHLTYKRVKNIVNCCFREKLFELESCIHPTVMKDMCAECGADLRKEDLSMTASVPMVHSIPELKVSEEVMFINLKYNFT